MSVLYDVEPGQLCEECWLPVASPAVARQGWRSLVWCRLCAKRVGLSLIADEREATLARDPQPHWRNRVVAAVRHRLQVEERLPAA